MSLFETGRSTGRVSLAELLEGTVSASSDPGLTVTDLAEEIALGGWPGLRGRGVADGLLAVRDYLDEIARVDISRVEATHRDPNRVARLLASLGRNVATHAAATTLAKDTGGADGPLKDDTVREYLRRAGAADGHRGPTRLGAASALLLPASHGAEAALRRSFAGGGGVARDT